MTGTDWLPLRPACATIIGVIVLAQIPSPAEAAGITLVIAGVALHHPADQPLTAIPE